MRVILFFILLISSVQCTSQVKTDMQKKPIEQVLKENQDELLSIKGVQGFYQGITDDSSDCIIVMVDTLTKEIQKEIPDSLDGYPVLIEETGEIKPLDNQSPEK